MIVQECLRKNASHKKYVEKIWLLPNMVAKRVIDYTLLDYYSLIKM